jgi:hypothetical protein
MAAITRTAAPQDPVYCRRPTLRKRYGTRPLSQATNQENRLPTPQMQVGMTRG